MVQDIFVLIIIWSAILYTVFQIVKVFIPSKNKSHTKCDGCMGCALKSNHKNIMNLSHSELTIRN